MNTFIKPQRAIIIGGGVGGLCTAIALRRLGMDAHVYERADMLGDVGAGLVIWANAIKALRELDISDAVIQSSSVIQHGQIRTSDGKILARTEPGELEKTFGVPTVAIHRAALHKALLSALPESNVHLGASCVSVEQDQDGVTARFSNGNEARGPIYSSEQTESTPSFADNCSPKLNFATLVTLPGAAQS